MRFIWRTIAALLLLNGTAAMYMMIRDGDLQFAQYPFFAFAFTMWFAVSAAAKTESARGHLWNGFCAYGILWFLLMVLASYIGADNEPSSAAPPTAYYKAVMCGIMIGGFLGFDILACVFWFIQKRAQFVNKTGSS